MHLTTYPFHWLPSAVRVHSQLTINADKPFLNFNIRQKWTWQWYTSKYYAGLLSHSTNYISFQLF